MSVAALIRSMAAAGAPPEAIALAVEAVEAAEHKDAARREAARDKKRRQRAGQVGDSPGTVPGHGGDSPEAPPLPRPSSPQTPLQPTPTPPDITTRARNADCAKPSDFDEFWAIYPNKVGKRDAATAYAKALKRIKGPDPPSLLLSGVVRALSSRKWLEGIIPNPATWLNQDRWEDQPAEIVPLHQHRAHERPHHDAKFEARQDNLARAFAGADSAARQRGEP